MGVIKRAYRAILYAAVAGQCMIVEAMTHGAFAQVATTGGVSVDPQTALSSALPWFQGVAASGVVGIAGARGVAAAHEHRNIMPAVYSGTGGTILIYGVPPLMRHLGVPI